VSGAKAAALLATEQGQSFRRKFNGDFEETEGFYDSQGNVERLSTNNSLPEINVDMSCTSAFQNANIDFSHNFGQQNLFFFHVSLLDCCLSCHVLDEANG
jgi:hypothetical protein